MWDDICLTQSPSPHSPRLSLSLLYCLFWLSAPLTFHFNMKNCFITAFHRAALCDLLSFSLAFTKSVFTVSSQSPRVCVVQLLYSRKELSPQIQICACAKANILSVLLEFMALTAGNMLVQMDTCDFEWVIV